MSPWDSLSIAMYMETKKEKKKKMATNQDSTIDMVIVKFVSIANDSIQTTFVKIFLART